MIEARPKANFYADLKFGQDAEKKFLEKYGEFLEATDGREGDYKITGTNIKIEHKTDKYCHDRWPNFVLERYRSGIRPGGPWQALEHNCKYFLYYFAKNDRMYLFNTYRLCKRIESLVRKRDFKLETINNGSYDTSYYRIPRSEFEDLMLQFHSTIEREYKKALEKHKRSKCGI